LPLSPAGASRSAGASGRFPAERARRARSWRSRQRCAGPVRPNYRFTACLSRLPVRVGAVRLSMGGAHAAGGAGSAARVSVEAPGASSGSRASWRPAPDLGPRVRTSMRGVWRQGTRMLGLAYGVGMARSPFMLQPYSASSWLAISMEGSTSPAALPITVTPCGLRAARIGARSRAQAPRTGPRGRRRARRQRSRLRPQQLSRAGAPCGQPPRPGARPGRRCRRCRRPPRSPGPPYPTLSLTA